MEITKRTINYIIYWKNDSATTLTFNTTRNTLYHYWTLLQDDIIILQINLHGCQLCTLTNMIRIYI